MLKRIFGYVEFGVAQVLSWSIFLVLLLLAVLFCEPAIAQVVSAPASAPAVVQVQPFLHDLLILAGIFATGAVPIIAQPIAAAAVQHFHLKNEDAVRSSFVNLLDQAAHYGLAFAADGTSSVGPIKVGNPVVSAAANWLLVHACDEIEHLNLNHDEVISAAQAAVAPYINGTRGLAALASA